MRVPHLILPSLAAAVALAGTSPATAASINTTSPPTGSSGGAGIGAAPAPSAPSSTGSTSPGTAATVSGKRPTVPGTKARIIHGVAYAPAGAPIQVQRAIWAGDRIRHKPYRMGGGHGTWNDTAYDCSGSVSYLLHAAGLLSTSMDSSQFESWGRRGLGQWITVYTNPGHAFIQIAGIRLDTSAEQDPHPAPGSGPRWRPLMRSTSGYLARHPGGL